MYSYAVEERFGAIRFFQTNDILTDKSFGQMQGFAISNYPYKAKYYKNEKELLRNIDDLVFIIDVNGWGIIYNDNGDKIRVRVPK